MSNLNNGNRERAIKREFRARCEGVNAACWQCRQPIDYLARAQTPNAFEADHYHPVSTHPHLGYDMSNLRPSHCRCNRSRQAGPPPTSQWIRADW